MWAGMSSGPSRVCWKYSAPSGTARSNHAAKSRRTSGLAFSLSVSDAEVWRRNRCASPTPTSRSSGTPSTTSSVTRWKPRGRARSWISRWCHIGHAAYEAPLGERDRGWSPPASREQGVDEQQQHADDAEGEGEPQRRHGDDAGRGDERQHLEVAGSDRGEVAEPAAGQDGLTAARPSPGAMVRTGRAW